MLIECSQLSFLFLNVQRGNIESPLHPINRSNSHCFYLATSMLRPLDRARRERAIERRGPA